MRKPIKAYKALIQRSIAKGAEYINVCPEVKVRELETEHKLMMNTLEQIKAATGNRLACSILEIIEGANK